MSYLEYVLLNEYSSSLDVLFGRPNDDVGILGILFYHRSVECCWRTGLAKAELSCHRGATE